MKKENSKTNDPCLELERKYPPKVKAMYEAVLELFASGRELSTLKVSEITAQAGIGKGTATIVSIEKEEIEKEETEGRAEKINRKLAASAEIMFAIGSEAD